METRTVKTIKIFLASSSELKNDRDAFGDFMMRLQKHYETRDYTFQLEKWEYLNPAYNNKRKQDEYNDIIRECDLFVVIFHTKIGEFTLEEFEVALEECRKRSLPLFIYFKDLQGREKPDDIKQFQNRIVTELKHFWGVYNNNDKLFLDFVLWLDSYLFDGNSELKANDNIVTLGGVEVARMSELSFAANNDGFKQMYQTIQEYPDIIQKLRERTLKYPDDKEFQDELQQALDNFNALKTKFKDYQHLLLNTAKLIANWNQEQTNEQLQRAIIAFESGNMDGANAILNEIALEAEAFYKHFENNRKQLHKYIDAFQLQAKTEMAKLDTPISERIANVAEIYAKADDWANRSSYPLKKYANLLLDYARFLLDYVANYQKAKQFYERLIGLYEEIYDDNSSHMCIAYNNIGMVCYHENEYTNALDYYFKALTILEKIYSRENPLFALTYNNIGTVYLEQDDSTKAFEFFSKALAIFESFLDENDPDMAIAYNNMGMVCYHKRDLVNALKYYFKSLAIFENSKEDETPLLATIYNNLGTVYFEQKDSSNAFEFFFKALIIDEKVLGYQHPSTAIVYLNIGTAYMHQKEMDKAMEYNEKAMAVFENVWGENHDKTALAYRNIVEIYDNNGNTNKAFDFRYKILSIYERKMRISHPDVVTNYNDLDLDNNEQDKYVKILNLLIKIYTHLKIELGSNNKSVMELHDKIETIKSLLSSRKLEKNDS